MEKLYNLWITEDRYMIEHLIHPIRSIHDLHYFRLYYGFQKHLSSYLLVVPAELIHDRLAGHWL
jgi:hypothetical protein